MALLLLITKYSPLSGGSEKETYIQKEGLIRRSGAPAGVAMAVVIEI